MKRAWPKTKEAAKEWMDEGLIVEDTSVAWGSYEGRDRRGCAELPEFLLGAPLGQYHCPVCMVMCIAGMSHMEPDEKFPMQDPETGGWREGETVPYEVFTGQEWPTGYYPESYTRVFPRGKVVELPL